MCGNLVMYYGDNFGTEIKTLDSINYHVIIRRSKKKRKKERKKEKKSKG